MKAPFVALAGDLLFDQSRYVWVEPEGGTRVDADEGEVRAGRAIAWASDLRVGSQELRRAARDLSTRYHLGGARANLLRPVRDALRGRVLEIGAGCGALTRFLGENGGTVVALESSLRRAAICRSRCRDLDNVEVLCADLVRGVATGPYDAVVLVGGLEHAASGMASADPLLEVIQLCERALADDGILVLAVDNGLALERLSAPAGGGSPAGLRQAVEEPRFASLGRADLDAVLRTAGFEHRQFLYPFPDYRCPRVIASDAAFERQPLAVANLLLSQAANVSSMHGAEGFGDPAAWPALIRNGIGPDLANSFLVVASRQPARRFVPRLAYAYAGDWRRCFEREVVLDDDGGGIVVRRAHLYADRDVPAAPFRQRVADEPWVPGDLVADGLHEVLGHDRWTAAAVADRAEPWVEYLLARSDSGPDGAGLADRTMDPALLDCTPFNLVRTAEGRLVPFGQEWRSSSRVTVGDVVFRGLVATIRRIRSIAPPADASMTTLGAFAGAVMQALGFRVDEANLHRFAEQEASLRGWLTGERPEGRQLLAEPLPPIRVPPTVDTGAELVTLRRELARRTADGETAAAAVAVRDDIIRDLQRQLDEQTAWARNSAAEVARRDVMIGDLQASLREQTAWARSSADEVVKRDAIIGDLQGRTFELAGVADEHAERARSSTEELAQRDAVIAGLSTAARELRRSVEEHAGAARASAAEIERQDAVIVELRACVAEQSRAAQAAAARVVEQDGMIHELQGRLDEGRTALAAVVRRYDERLEALEREHRHHTADLAQRLETVDRQVDELQALSRRSLVHQARAAFHAQRGRPWIGALRPGWAEAGRGFDRANGGPGYLQVEGGGFGSAAMVVVAGWPMETVRVSERILSAYVPDELFARPGVLSVWVDNRDGGRPSPIRGLRVMSGRTLAAYRPASGPWRRLRDVWNFIVWLMAGLVSRIQIPLFYARRARETLARRGPYIDLLYPAWTEAGKTFNSQRDGRASLAARGSGFGSEAILVIAGYPMETFRVSDTLLTASVPDEVFARPGVLPVWVDNRDGDPRRSRIRRFRVMSRRTVDAYQPASGRWRQLEALFHAFRWFIAGLWARVQTPRLYLQRARGRRLRRLATIGVPEPRRPRSAATPEMIAAHIAPARRPRKPDVLCFSIIDWDFRYQRPQQLLSRLAESGHRIFYLSQRFLDPGGEAFRLRPLVPGVTEVFLRAPCAVNIYKDELHGKMEDAVYAALLDFRAASGLGETIVFVHLPFWTPLALRLSADLGHRVVFDCLDDFSGFGNIRQGMLALEHTLAERAHLVVASSRVLADKHAEHDPLLLPNAADYAHFSAACLPERRRVGDGVHGRARATLARWVERVKDRLDPPAPVIGYYGAIAHWFDASLIARAAAARPDWRFVLIGRTEPEVRAQLGGWTNVRLVGEVAYEDLPEHLASFDVCLIPFVVDDLIKATSPVKFFEYLAAGKPVVAARMPELLPFAGDCFLYDGLPEFLAQTERALAEKDDPARVEARRAVARAHTWQRRVDVLSRAFDALYPRASVIVVTYNCLDLTRACVESLLDKTAYADWELIVIDNHSSDETPAYLSALADRYPFVRVVLNDGNRGFAAANNQGVGLATGEFVVLLNNDTVVTQGWLGRLLRHLDEPGVGLVGPVTNTIGNEARIDVDYDGDLTGMETFADRYTREHARQLFDIPMLAMFCVAMRRRLLDEVGLLDERYEIGMFEDDDFTRSVKRRGYRVVCAEDVFVHHVGGASFKRLDEDTYRRIFEANRRRYEDKWGEPWVPHQYRRPESV